MPESDIAKAIAGAEPFRPPQDPPPDDGGGGPNGAGPCPVTPLGRRGDVYYFLSPAGELLARRSKDFNRNDIASLFDGDTSWLFDAFPHFSKDGEAIGWKFSMAGEWLMRECAVRGFFDVERQVRGPGVWRAGNGRGGEAPVGEGGGLIVHCGDALHTPGGWVDAGTRVGGHVYTAGLPERRPDFDRVEEARAVAAELLEFLRLWNWRAAPAPHLLFGWIAAAMVAGALRWRPIVLVSGGEGTGKSTIDKLLTGLFGTAALRASDPTAAGLRQELKGASRVVMVDEIEENPRNTRARDVVELARMGSTSEQAAVLRGSSDGRAQSYAVRAMFYLTSINPPALLPQDASRICVLDLDQLTANPEQRKRVQTGLRRFAETGAALAARMIAGFDRFERNFEVWEECLAAVGRNSRNIDQVGTLLAAADVLLSDHPTTPEGALAVLDGIELDRLDGGDMGDPELCLNHLLSATLVPELHVNGRRITYGEAIALAVGDGQDSEAARRALAAGGIAARRANLGAGRARAIAVAHRNTQLARVFAETPWQGGGWKTSLLRLPGADLARNADGTPNSLSFGGAKSRAVVIEGDHVPPPASDSPPPHPGDG